MNKWERLLIGALGALTPILLNLVVIDLEVLRLQVTGLAVASYLIRATALAFLGGLVAYLHKDETNRVKIFELGMVAPALIAGLMNASQRELPKPPRSEVSFVRTVYAQPGSKLKTFSYPVETRIEQIQRGIFGSVSERVWFVIVGSHVKLEDAARQVVDISRRWPKGEFKAEVYAPYGGNPYHAVVIGANLTRKEALQLQQRAKSAGLPKDTYLWTFPR